MRISDWSSDVCSSDLDSPPTSAPTSSGGATLPTDFGVALGDACFLAMVISSSVGIGTGRTAGIAPGTQPPSGGGHKARAPARTRSVHLHTQVYLRHRGMGHETSREG